MDSFPKDTRVTLQLLRERLVNFDFNQFIEVLKEYQENLLIKSVLDKKSEKNYISVFKNSTKYNYQK